MREESGYEDGYIAGSQEPIVLRNFMNTRHSASSRQLSGNQDPSVNNRRSQVRVSASHAGCRRGSPPTNP